MSETETAMPNDDIQHLIITQLRDVSSTSMHLAERVSGLEVKVSVLDSKVDQVLVKMDHFTEKNDNRLTTLETFRWQTQGVLAAIILIWAPLMAWVGWSYRSLGPIASAAAKTIGLHY
jgi:hypothetical protein